MTDTQAPPTIVETHGIRDDDRPLTEPTPAPEDVAPPLASLIASIRTAVARGASAEARAAGAIACRSILTVLDAKPGQPLVATPQPAAPVSTGSRIGSLLSQPGLLSKLAAMSRDELINLLREITGASSGPTRTPAAAAPRFHLIQIPQVRRPDGDR